jgi:hypothetical protein
LFEIIGAAFCAKRMYTRGMAVPDFSKAKLDFSQFHPLDHSVWACRDYPGGRRTHLAYRWDFQWSGTVKRWTLCLLGKHEPVKWHPGPRCPDQAIHTACGNCYKEL